MANKKYEQGRRLEWRTIKNFEDMGCTAIRSAGSHSLVDVIAWDTRSVWITQIKSGSGRMTPAELEAFKELPAPPNCIKQIHHYYKVANRWELVIKNVKDMATNS